MSSNATFSQKLKRLEEVVARLESPDVELEEGLKLLEEGVGLHKQCQHMLTQTQAKITQLLDSSANPETSQEVVEPETKIEATTLFETTVEADEPVEPSQNDQLPF